MMLMVSFTRSLHPCIKISCGNRLCVEMFWLKCCIWLQLKNAALRLADIFAESGQSLAPLAPLWDRFTICQPLLACLWSCPVLPNVRLINTAKMNITKASDMSCQRLMQTKDEGSLKGLSPESDSIRYAVLQMYRTDWRMLAQTLQELFKVYCLPHTLSLTSSPSIKAAECWIKAAICRIKMN